MREGGQEAGERKDGDEKWFFTSKEEKRRGIWVSEDLGIQGFGRWSMWELYVFLTL